MSLCKRKNGDSFYAERTSNMLRDEKGIPVAIYGVFRDISERKKAEQEVAESEKRYRLLFDSLKEGVYQSEPGPEGAFTWINQVGAEILGFSSPGEVVGTKVKDVYVNPDDRIKLLLKSLGRKGYGKVLSLFVREKMANVSIWNAHPILLSTKRARPLGLMEYSEILPNERSLKRNCWNLKNIIDNY